MSKLAVAFKLRLRLNQPANFARCKGNKVCLSTPLFSLGCQEVLRSWNNNDFWNAVGIKGIKSLAFNKFAKKHLAWTGLTQNGGKFKKVKNILKSLKYT